MGAAAKFLNLSRGGRIQDYVKGGECEIQIAPLPARSCLRLELMKRSELIHLLLYSRAGVHIIPKIADFLDPKIIFCPQLKNIFKFS